MIVVAASRDLELSLDVISKIAAAFAASAPDETLGIRTRLNGEFASPAEYFAYRLASMMGRSYSFWSAETSRSGVYRRDYRMVENASEVLAFFSTDNEMEGGTGHVVKAALDRGIRVEAYSVRPDGTLEYLGSDEGDPAHRHHEPNAVLARMWREAQTT